MFLYFKKVNTKIKTRKSFYNCCDVMLIFEVRGRNAYESSNSSRSEIFRPQGKKRKLITESGCQKLHEDIGVRTLYILALGVIIRVIMVILTRANLAANRYANNAVKSTALQFARKPITVRCSRLGKWHKKMMTQHNESSHQRYNKLRAVRVQIGGTRYELFRLKIEIAMRDVSDGVISN